MSDFVDDMLELMHILDRVVEEGECLLWTGYLGSSGHPMIKVRKKCRLVRREVFRLCCGNLVPRQPIATRCDERCCVNPAHLFPSSISSIGKKAAKLGAWKGQLRNAKIAATKRAKGKLTIEQAREIRMSTESGPVLARRFNVNTSLINGIKRGSAWKDYANPYVSLISAGGAK